MKNKKVITLTKCLIFIGLDAALLTSIVFAWQISNKIVETTEISMKVREGEEGEFGSVDVSLSGESGEQILNFFPGNFMLAYLSTSSENSAINTCKVEFDSIVINYPLVDSSYQYASSYYQNDEYYSLKTDQDGKIIKQKKMLNYQYITEITQNDFIKFIAPVTNAITCMPIYLTEDNYREYESIHETNALFSLNSYVVYHLLNNAKNELKTKGNKNYLTNEKAPSIYVKDISYSVEDNASFIGEFSKFNNKFDMFILFYFDETVTSTATFYFDEENCDFEMQNSNAFLNQMLQINVKLSE